MSDDVVFHTADPVTGTTMLMGDNGTYTYKEESEPLGQRIEPVDPSPGYPTEYTEITDIASQPEWNCAIMKEFSGGFFNMPVECQKKEAEMMDFSIEGMLYDIDQANLERATEAKFGKDIGKIRKSDEIKKELGYVLRATAKRSGGGEQGSVIEANVPDPCAWDNGNPDCEVNVPSGDIPGFVDASENGNNFHLVRNARGDVSAACQKALDITKKDSNSVTRARANWDLLLQVEKKYGISAAIIAAIGVRESGFENVKERGSGKGRGVFQIDMGWHASKISEADAMDITKSAFYMGKILRGWYDDHYEAARGAGYSILNNSRPSVSSIAASVHAYNSGKAYTRHYKNPKDVSQGFDYNLSNGFKTVLDGGGVNSLDAGTTGSNYVSNVWNIARDCFGYGVKL